MSVYTLISGSTRPNSQSSKVAGYIASVLAALEADATVEIVDLAKVPLPGWHEGFWAQGPPPDENWAQVSALLGVSDGLVVVAPEWNGMTPPALMNVFLLAGRGELAHKPALIVTVSAGSGGAYPVVELRTFGYKNTQIVYLPDHVIVRGARHVLNGPEPESDADGALRERIAYSVDVLRVYTEALGFVRRSGVVQRERYPNGM